MSIMSGLMEEYRIRDNRCIVSVMPEERGKLNNVSTGRHLVL
jgi:hypothetical protein